MMRSSPSATSTKPRWKRGYDPLWRDSAPASPKPRPSTPCRTQPGTVYSIITDPEVTQTAISVFTKIRPLRPIDGRRIPQADGRANCSATCCPTVSKRFSQQPNAPFLAAQTSRGTFVRTAEVTSLNALVAPGGVERGLTALFTEIDRVARFGFTATELNRQARGQQRALENATASRTKAVRPAGRRVHQELSARRTDSGHRVRVRAEPAFPAE